MPPDSDCGPVLSLPDVLVNARRNRWLLASGLSRRQSLQIPEWRGARGYQGLRKPGATRGSKISAELGGDARVNERYGLVTSATPRASQLHQLAY